MPLPTGARRGRACIQIAAGSRAGRTKSVPNPNEWSERIRELELKGDHLLAYDTARQAAAEHADEAHFGYLAVRNLARCGATTAALAAYEDYGLARHAIRDYRALRARIEKDVALGLAGEARKTALLRAADLYATTAREFGGYYPAVNAATLYQLAGDERRARGFARETLALCARDLEKDDHDEYFRLASQVEAHLVLDEVIEAMIPLHKLARIDPGNLAGRASTRKQLRLLLEAKKLTTSILDPLTPPMVLHYVGHIFGAKGARDRLSGGKEREIAAAIAAAFDGHRIGFAFGSLAAGSDILFAEECLRRKIDLHVVLPLARDEFKGVSLAPAGEDWLRRFDACLAGAASVSHSNDGEHLGDDSLFEYGSRMAMGHAALRSQHIDAEAIQFAVWDGRPGGVAGGTAVNIEIWGKTRRKTQVIPMERPDKSGRIPQQTRAEAEAATQRELRAIAFGDTKQFSQLVPERLLPVYRKEYLGRIAASMQELGADALAANSWGDAIYLVVANAERAARWAIGVQTMLRGMDYAAQGFAAPLQLRLSVHFGPVYRGTDEVTKLPTFYGTEVTRVARIEPITPPGEVFATEAMAAELALAPAPGVSAEYVGHRSLDKDAGEARMYLLRPAPARGAGGSAKGR
jgi:hypothetical protein